MFGLPAIVDIPLSIDAYGAIRVSGTRVLLDVIIVAFQAGATPEAIVQRPDCNPRSRPASIRWGFARAFSLVNAARVEYILLMRNRRSSAEQVSADPCL
jgi:hypothetical protein